jgi:hypothetical protein
MCVARVCPFVAACALPSALCFLASSCCCLLCVGLPTSSQRPETHPAAARQKREGKGREGEGDEGRDGKGRRSARAWYNG